MSERRAHNFLPPRPSSSPSHPPPRPPSFSSSSSSFVGTPSGGRRQSNSRSSSSWSSITAVSFLLVLGVSFIFITMTAPSSSPRTPTLPLPPSPPFLRAKNRHLDQGEVFRRKGGVSGSVNFVILCDPQLGFMSQDLEWEQELKQLREGVHHINRLRPDFVVVIGDLAQKWPWGEKLERRDRELADLNVALSELHPDISLVIAAGNHDVGNQPTEETIRRHEDVYGDSTFSFRWSGGEGGDGGASSSALFIVTNSSLFFDPSGAPDLAEAQLQWLKDELRKAKEDKVDQIVFFAHHPFFVGDWEEDENVGSRFLPVLSKSVNLSHFQIKKERRTPLLELLREHNVKYSFHGHTHWNSVLESGGLNQVITTAIGLQLGDDQPGFRTVEMEPSTGTLHHQFHTLEELKRQEEQEEEEEKGGAALRERGPLGSPSSGGGAQKAAPAAAAVV